MFTLYTFGDLPLFVDGIRAVSMLFDPAGPDQMFVSNGTSGLAGAFNIGWLGIVALLFSFLVIVLRGIAEQSLRLDHLLLSMIVFTILFVPKERLQIEDVLSGQVAAVNDVPLVIAFVGGTMSQLSLRLAETFETVFQIPTGAGGGDWVQNWQGLDLGGGGSNGLNSPLRILLAVRGVMPEEAGNHITTNLAHYVRNCTLNGVNQSLWAASGAKIDYVLNNPGTGTTYLYDPTTTVFLPGQSCATAANTIRTQLNTYLSTAAGGSNRFKDQLCQHYDSNPAYTGGGLPACDGTDYVDAYDQLIPSLGTGGVSAAAFMKNLLFHQLARSTMNCGEQSDEVSFTQCVATMTQSQEQTRVQNAAAGTGFAKIMLTAMNLFLFLFYTLSPIISLVILATGMAGIGIAGKYLLFGVWAHSWMPFAVVIDFFVEASARQELHNFGVSVLRGNFDGDRFYDILADHVSLGADLLAATPLVSLAILSGSIFSLSSLAGRISGKDHVDETMAAPATLRNGPLLAQAYDRSTTPTSHADAIAERRGAGFLMSRAAEEASPKIDVRSVADGATAYLKSAAAGDDAKAALALTDSFKRASSIVDHLSSGDSLTETEQAVKLQMVQVGSQIMEQSGVKWDGSDKMAMAAALMGSTGLDAKGHFANKDVLKNAVMQFAGSLINYEANDSETVSQALTNMVESAQRESMSGRNDLSLQNQDMAQRVRQSMSRLDSRFGTDIENGLEMRQSAEKSLSNANRFEEKLGQTASVSSGQSFSTAGHLRDLFKQDIGLASRINDQTQGVPGIVRGMVQEANANGGDGRSILTAYNGLLQHRRQFNANDKNLQGNPTAIEAVSQMEAMAMLPGSVVNKNGEQLVAQGGQYRAMSSLLPHIGLPAMDSSLAESVSGGIEGMRGDSNIRSWSDLDRTRTREMGAASAKVSGGRASLENKRPNDQAQDNLTGRVGEGFSTQADTMTEAYRGGAMNRTAQDGLNQKRAMSIGPSNNLGPVIDLVSYRNAPAGAAVKELTSAWAGLAEYALRNANPFHENFGKSTGVWDKHVAPRVQDGFTIMRGNPGLQSQVGSDPRAQRLFALSYALNTLGMTQSLMGTGDKADALAESLGPERASRIESLAEEWGAKTTRAAAQNDGMSGLLSDPIGSGSGGASPQAPQSQAGPSASTNGSQSTNGGVVDIFGDDHQFAASAPLNVPRGPSFEGGAASSSGRLGGLQPDFASSLSAMMEDAKGAGHGVSIFSGYRSHQKQTALWNDAVKKYGDPEIADNHVARPGGSSHEYGLAADLRFSSPDAREWVHSNARNYGLHFRMGHENWHIEPIGARDRIADMHNTG